MKLSYSCKALSLYGENDFEKHILSSNNLRTKLAYTDVNYDMCGLKISISGKKCLVDLEKNTAFIAEYLSESQIGYMLRVILDAYVLSKEILPLHSSMISIDSKSAFLFGGTNCGKSTFSHYIKKMNPKCNVIGDDHIIIANEGVIGNSFSRIRSIDNGKELYVKNLSYVNDTEKYFIFDIDIKDKFNNYKVLTPNEYMKKDLSNVLKYLICDFNTGREILKVDEIIKYEVESKYLQRFSEFLNNAHSIIRIRGSIDYVTQFINDILI